MTKGDPANVPEKIGIGPWNNQTRFAATSDPVNKNHSSFLMDELGDLISQIVAGNAGANDGIKDIQTRLVKCTQAAPVATATLPASPFKAIDVVNTDFNHTIRVRLTLATDQGDVDAFFIVLPELAIRLDFNSDAIKALRLDVLSDTVENLASSSGADAASLAVFDGASAPANLAAVAVITFLNA